MQTNRRTIDTFLPARPVVDSIPSTYNPAILLDVTPGRAGLEHTTRMYFYLFFLHIFQDNGGQPQLSHA